MNNEDLTKRINELEAQVKRQGEHIEQLSKNILHTPSRLEFDSLTRQQQGVSILDGVFDGLFG